MFQWTVPMLITGALFTGGAFWYAWDRVPIWRRQTMDEFVVDFRRSIRRGDPAQPLLLVASLGSTVGFLSATNGSTRLLATMAAAGMVVILVGSAGLLVPVQNRFRRLPEGAVPPGADRLRRRWLAGHLVRTALALGTFTFLVGAVSIG